jgi:hypothetical protein
MTNFSNLYLRGAGFASNNNNFLLGAGLVSTNLLIGSPFSSRFSTSSTNLTNNQVN